MLYLPGSVTDLETAEGPYLGGEWAVFLSAVPALLIGTVTFTASGAATYAANPGAAIATNGSDLQIVAANFVSSSAAVSIEMACMDNSATPIAMNATATFAPVARAANQTFNFPRGYATDFVPATAGKQVTSITGIGTVTGGSPNSQFRIYQLPQLTDYTLIPYTTDVNFSTRGRAAKGINWGMETDAFIKLGMSKAADLTMSSNFRGFADDLSRFDGQPCTAMLIGLKDGQIIGDRLVFVRYVPNLEIKNPAGEGESMADASSGKFQELLMFVAPGP
ncbi:MAG TPA: hypothetical protein VGY56_11275 [Verrucomicrobiae bacterium]|nr:hypothetical protein [Verrucomicrobiae bacterium]